MSNRQMMRVLAHAPGPAAHGVVRHARQIAKLCAQHDIVTVTAGPAALSHVQFTDQLFGPHIAAATAAFLRWARSVPRPLVATLHDLPGQDLDHERDLRRGAGYTAIAHAVDCVVVSSEHEARLVARLTRRPTRVITLPLTRLPAPRSAPRWSATPTLGLLGFLYPGKGHAEAIAAAARCRPVPLVVAAGTPAPGHEYLVDQLQTAARSHGVRFVVTGALDDQEMADAADAVTVPIAPARSISASGSLATWLGAGRRPIAAAGAYTQELGRRYPDSLILYTSDDELDVALRRAFADPSHSRLSAVATASDPGADHAALYRELTGDLC